MGAGQQFRTPGRHPGSGVQQRHKGFAPVEGGVERGEVADLEGHRTQTGEGGEGVERGRGARVWCQVTQCAQRGPGLLKAPRQPGAADERPHQQPEANLESSQPGHDLQDELNRSLGGQNPIAKFVGVEMVGDEMEDCVDRDGDGSGKPAADAAGDDDGADHTPSGGENQERTSHRRQVTAENHASASHGRSRCWLDLFAPRYS